MNTLELGNKINNSIFGRKVGSFLYSHAYLLIIAALASVGFAFRLEREIFAILILIGCFVLITARDFTPNVIILISAALITIARYGQEDYFYPLRFFAIPLFLSFIAHFILYPVRPGKSIFLYPTAAVALAVTLGGLFSPYFFSSFSFPAAYYVTMLGAGMLALCVFFISYIVPREGLSDYFAWSMALAGAVGVIMVVSYYIRYGTLISGNLGQFMSKFQWGNNLSNALLLTMPFAFYLAAKGKLPAVFFTLGILQYAAMMLTFSRGGILFSTIMLPVLIIATIKYNRKDRLTLLLTLLAVTLIFAAVFTTAAKELGAEIFNELKVSGSEARVNLYKLAFENFLKYPVFGTGLGYVGPQEFYNPQRWCIYWYHSTPFQIIGSMGILGILCYGYQAYIRARHLLTKRNIFKIFVLFSFLGFEGYSLVNVGNFVPVPCVMTVLLIFIVSEKATQH